MMAGGVGGGFERGANALGQNLMAGISLGMQQKRYDQYDERYKQGVEREEKQFNRKMEIERGKLGLPPSYHEESADPQEQATNHLNANVMAHQDFAPTREAALPSSATMDAPSQVGRLELPGSRMRSMPPPMSYPGVMPSTPMTRPSPAMALMRPGGADTEMPVNPPSGTFSRGPGRQSMMPRLSRPRYR